MLVLSFLTDTLADNVFVIENANTDLLPLDLDPMVPDNQILSVAMKYMEEKPIIISDDGVLDRKSTRLNSSHL